MGGITTLWAATPGSPDLQPIVTDQVTYQSADGTEVRMFVIHRATSKPPAGPSRPFSTATAGSRSRRCRPTRPRVAAWVERGGV